MLYYVDPTQTEFFINETSSPMKQVSVDSVLYHVFAVKYKKMWVVLVKIIENLHILG